MTGRANPDYNDLKLEFGSYVQVFEDNDPSTTTTSRKTGAIVMNPTGNAQGDYHFMSLTTGKRLSRHQWTEIPMTNAVISAVESMAEKEGQPLIKGGVPLFEWRPNVPVEDTLEEDVTSTDDPVFIIEDVFEIPGDDADADLSDNVENGPNDYVLEDAPDNDPIDGDDLAETDDPAGFEPDGFEPGADDENGTITGVEDDFDRD